MNELEFERKSTVEKDIEDLFNRITNERISLKSIGIIGGLQNAVSRSETLGEKNYSTYRKLIDSFKKLTRLHYQLLQQYNVNANIFYAKLTEAINREIKNCHKIMADSLDRENDEQYRCLNDSYIKLMELSSEIDRNDTDTCRFEDSCVYEKEWDME